MITRHVRLKTATLCGKGANSIPLELRRLLGREVEGDHGGERVAGHRAGLGGGVGELGHGVPREDSRASLDFPGMSPSQFAATNIPALSPINITESNTPC